MSLKKRRIAVLGAVLLMSVATSTSAVADPGDPICWVVCNWTDIGCMLEKLRNLCP